MSEPILEKHSQEELIQFQMNNSDSHMLKRVKVEKSRFRLKFSVPERDI